jgi:hypothetical protein
MRKAAAEAACELDGTTLFRDWQGMMTGSATAPRR